MRKQTTPPPHLKGGALAEWLKAEDLKASLQADARKQAIIQAITDPSVIHGMDSAISAQSTVVCPDDGETQLARSLSAQRPKNCVLSHRKPIATNLPPEPQKMADRPQNEARGAIYTTIMEVEGFLPKSEAELYERIEMLFAPGITGFYGDLVQEHEILFEITRMLHGYFEGDKTKALNFTEERLDGRLAIESVETIWHRVTAPAWALEKALGYSRQDWDHPYLCGSLHHRSRTRQLAQASYGLQKIHGPEAWFLLNQKTLATLLKVSQQDIARMLSNLVRIDWLDRRKRHGSRSLEYQCLGHLLELEDDEN